MILLHPLWLVLLLLLPLPWLFLRRKDYVGHPNVNLLEGIGDNQFLRRLPLILFSLGFVFVVICLARPQVRKDDATQVIKSRDIIMAVDISGSMSAQFDDQIPPPEKGGTELDKELPPTVPMPQYDYNGRPIPNYNEPGVGKRRIDAAASAVTRFIRHRYLRGQGDRVAILPFDTEPHWSWPLTDDLKMVYRKGLFIDQGLGGGTNFGATDPGPIDAAAEHFDERGQAASKVLIIVTDGEDTIHSSAMNRLIRKIQERGIRFYVIGVGSNMARGGNYDILRLAEAVGGQSFRVDNAQEMARCFDSIDELERSPVEVSTRAVYEDVFAWFAVVGLCLVALACVTELFVVSH